MLGKFKKVGLRDIWNSEPSDFTPWLAREENLAILGEAIGVELEFEAQEKEVGPYQADILCRNLDNRHDDSWVVIENQLERTDHIHLGQLLTYAAGLKAATTVWIAAKFSDEHRAALDWLNQITDESVNFFGLEIELWQIDDSIPAPKFNIISQPNNWSRNLSQAARSRSHTVDSPIKTLQQSYWAHLSNYLRNANSFLNTRSPRGQHWYNFSIGKSNVDLTATVNTQAKRLGVEIFLGAENATAFFNLLMEDRQAIETELGHPLDWQALPEKQGSRIAIYTEGDATIHAEWANQHKWFKETLESFSKVFKRRIKALNPSDWTEDTPGLPTNA